MSDDSATRGPRNLPYHVLALLLYRRSDWITRHPHGAITVATGPLGVALATRPVRLRHALEQLVELGLATAYAWHRHYVTITPAMPLGCGLILDPEVLDV